MNAKTQVYLNISYTHTSLYLSPLNAALLYEYMLWWWCATPFPHTPLHSVRKRLATAGGGAKCLEVDSSSLGLEISRHAYCNHMLLIWWAADAADGLGSERKTIRASISIAPPYVWMWYADAHTLSTTISKRVELNMAQSATIYATYTR